MTLGVFTCLMPYIMNLFTPIIIIAMTMNSNIFSLTLLVALRSYNAIKRSNNISLIIRFIYLITLINKESVPRYSLF